MFIELEGTNLLLLRGEKGVALLDYLVNSILGKVDLAVSSDQQVLSGSGIDKYFRIDQLKRDIWFFENELVMFAKVGRDPSEDDNPLNPKQQWAILKFEIQN